MTAQRDMLFGATAPTSLNTWNDDLYRGPRTRAPHTAGQGVSA